MRLWLLKYNNYYNRVIKKHDFIGDYVLEVGQANATHLDNVSFNPSDGVNTSQIFNQIDDTYDYAILTIGEREDEVIKSRWFIIEAERTRTGQYNLKLRRDLVADNLDEIKSAPMFIEKATVGLNDSAIFNSENIDFNEIKTKETLLKDKTNSAWIALYLANDKFSTSGSVNFKGEADFDLTTQAHTSWAYYNVLNKAEKPDDIDLAISVAEILAAYRVYINKTSTWHKYEVPASGVNYMTQSMKQMDRLKALYRANKETIVSSFLNDLSNEEDWATNMSDVEKYNNKLIAFSDGYYRCTVEKKIVAYEKESGVNLTTSFSNLKNTLEALFNTDPTIHWHIQQNESGYRKLYKAKTNLTIYTVRLTQEATVNSTYEYTVSETGNLTEDQPYNIILLPYNDLKFRTGGGAPKTAKQNISLLVAKDIIENNKGSSKLIDAQIVPYFTNPEAVIDSEFALHKINLDAYTEGVDYDLVKTDDGSDIATFIWYANKASFTTRITADCGNTDISWPASVLAGLTDTDIKTAIETEKLRICSPNYNGVFEFQPIKAGINSNEIEFDIDCTYMPQTPYIHINPVFNGRLYGSDFDDARGLICGGDFSMAQSSDAWETYKAQNKNFQIAFNRQIENMEINNSIQRTNELISVPVNAVQSGIRGAFSGAQFGGGVGAAIGGVVGANVSAAAGAIDIILADKLRQEALDYTKDQFGYQLGNIKALPDSLVKLPAQTYNNKIWPFVEFYTCTSEEKEALKNKIKYNGMTIMRIGTINDFIKPEETYIKGRLIRTDSIHADAHEVLELGAELNQGIFIKE